MSFCSRRSTRAGRVRSGTEALVETLKQRHDELRAIYTGMVDGLLIADIETKKFVRANQAICEMLRYTQEELLSRSVMDIHPPEALDEVLAAFEELAAGRLGVAENLPVLRKDGTVFYADITTNRLLYQGRHCNIGFFRDITDRKKANEALHKEHRVLNQLLKTQDQERKVIAYEIHDGLTQQLVGALMRLQAMDRLKQQVPRPILKEHAVIRKLLEQSLAEARRLINGVRPPVLDEFGVVPAIQHLVDENAYTARHVQVSFESHVEFDRLEPMLENTIYRIVQEALSNAQRHSQSNQVQIQLVEKRDLIHILVRDWGIGFDPDAVDEDRFGLAGIRERARLLGGTVEIDTGCDRGTCVVVELPVVGKKT